MASTTSNVSEGLMARCVAFSSPIMRSSICSRPAVSTMTASYLSLVACKQFQKYPSGMRLKGAIQDTARKICCTAHCVVASAVSFTGMHEICWNLEEPIAAICKVDDEIDQDRSAWRHLTEADHQGSLPRGPAAHKIMCNDDGTENSDDSNDTVSRLTAHLM